MGGNLDSENTVNKQSAKQANAASAREWIKINRWSVFAMVVFSAVATIFYISNVIRVNNLLEQNQELKKELMSLRNANELLNSKVIELQSAERITKIAEERLGMIKPTKAPEIIQ